jgi:hypothetical protein
MQEFCTVQVQPNAIIFYAGVFHVSSHTTSQTFTNNIFSLVVPEHPTCRRILTIGDIKHTSSQRLFSSQAKASEVVLGGAMQWALQKKITLQCLFRELVEGE